MQTAAWTQIRPEIVCDLISIKLFNSLIVLMEVFKTNVVVVFLQTVKGLVNLQKTFCKLLLIEKPVMRETECRKPHQKFNLVTKL